MGAPRVTVREHRPWYWRAIAVLAVLGLSLGAALWVYDEGRRYAGFDSGASQQQILTLTGRVAELEAELGKLRTLTNASASTLQIETSAKEQLARQVRALEQENVRLKEDLAFFENLASRSGSDAGVTINRLQVRPESVPGEYRYRMLIAAQGGKNRDFSGSIQLIVEVERAGQRVMMIFPEEGDADRRRFDIQFRHFTRVDGIFRIPSDARAVSVEVRLMQDGTRKASQTLSL